MTISDSATPMRLGPSELLAELYGILARLMIQPVFSTGSA